MGKLYHANTNHKKAGMTVSISKYISEKENYQVQSGIFKNDKRVNSSESHR